MPHRRRFGREVVRFRDEMDHLFNRFFDMDFPISRRLFGDGEWAPRVDVSEGKDEITVKAEKDENSQRLERIYGSFCRMMELPGEVNPEDIDATYKKGVLKLVFKKTWETEAIKIEIKTS